MAADQQSLNLWTIKQCIQTPDLIALLNETHEVAITFKKVKKIKIKNKNKHILSGIINII